MSEASETFACFGSSCTVLVASGSESAAAQAVADARAQLLEWHRRFTRFDPTSELSRLNADPRAEVPVSRDMLRLARAVRRAGALTGGLVDATLLAELERCGYDGELGEPVPLARALSLAGARRAARPRENPGWRLIETDASRGTVRRPPGVLIDSGGLAKGMFADLLAARLAGHDAVAVVCAGDLAVAGRATRAREVHVESPFDGSVLHTLELQTGGVATSGIGRRSWIGADGRAAHHLIDPSTGAPAFTGVVQATALAASALAAEVYAKAAVLAGPVVARQWLPQGGVLVLDDGTHEVVEPAAAVTLPARGHTPRAA